MYAERAKRIKAISELLISRWFLVAGNGTVSDKFQVIKTSAEVVNKLLYSYLISQEMFSDMGSKLNNALTQLKSDSDSINTMFYHVKDILIEFDKHAETWVKKHCNSEESDDE